MHPRISWAFIQSIRCLSFKSCSRTYFSSEDWLLSICILKSTIIFTGDEPQKMDRKLPGELKDLILEWTDYGLLFCGDYLGTKSKCSLPNSCHTQSLSILNWFSGRLGNIVSVFENSWGLNAHKQSFHQPLRTLSLSTSILITYVARFKVTSKITYWNTSNARKKGVKVISGICLQRQKILFSGV